MFRIWGKCFKDTRLVRDTVTSDSDYSKSRTKMVLDAVTGICRTFDLAEPIWLNSNIEDFRLHNKTRFGQDSFIETLDFDYLEIEVIEE
jgi:hypothetical protein